MNLRTSAVKLAAIGDIAEVRPGLSTGTRLAHQDGAPWQVVQSRHLVAGQPYEYSDEDRFTIDPGRDVKRYRLRAGDVLFMSRGTRNVASWIGTVPFNSVAPVSFFLLRPRREIEPSYLTWWLNQPLAQRAIDDIRTGAGTPIVQRRPFSELLLPVPDIPAQRRIAALGEAMVRERIILEQLVTATEQLHLLTSEHIARDLVARAESHDDE